MYGCMSAYNSSNGNPKNSSQTTRREETLIIIYTKVLLCVQESPCVPCVYIVD